MPRVSFVPTTAVVATLLLLAVAIWFIKLRGAVRAGHVDLFAGARRHRSGFDPLAMPLFSPFLYNAQNDAITLSSSSSLSTARTPISTDDAALVAKLRVYQFRLGIFRFLCFCWVFCFFVFFFFLQNN